MPEGPIFLDTVALVALVSRRDELHTQAAQLFRGMIAGGARLVTTDWVLSEFLNICAKRHLRGVAAATVRRFRHASTVTVLPASREMWDQGLVLYESRPDKEWSLIDCISILACRERGVMHVFTHDRHFEQAGFAVMLR